MLSAYDRVNKVYEGEGGRAYHAQVHRQDDRVQTVVSRQRLRKLQPHVGLNDDVLEYGVGLGVNLQDLSCRRRVGYDLSDAGRELCERSGIEFVMEANFAAGEFDVIICHHVLEHVPNPFETLNQLRGWLAPQGKLVLCVPFETLWSYRRFRENDPYHHLFSWNVLSLGNLVTAVGFRVLEARIRPFGYEQRLAGLARVHSALYRIGLWSIRTVCPANEIFLLATPDAERS